MSNKTKISYVSNELVYTLRGGSDHLAYLDELITGVWFFMSYTSTNLIKDTFQLKAT